jgi:hypothetical protein
MSVATTDLIWYGSANMDEADGSTQGGAIDATVRVIPDSSSLFNALSNGKVDIVSSNSGDNSQTVTIYGRNASGSIVSEALSLNGTTTVNGTLTYDRLEKIVISASHTGTVTVTAHTGGTTIVAIESGVTTIRRPFYNISADVGAGSSRTYYEKFFLKNTNGTNALLGAQIILQADPSSVMSFALDSAVNGTTTSTNRQTAPASGTGSFSTSAKNVPGTDLAAGDKVGVWWSLTLAAGTAATKTTFTARVSGSTT